MVAGMAVVPSSFILLAGLLSMCMHMQCQFSLHLFLKCAIQAFKLMLPYERKESNDIFFKARISGVLLSLVYRMELKYLRVTYKRTGHETSNITT